jgi:hypothetical protein
MWDDKFYTEALHATSEKNYMLPVEHYQAMNMKSAWIRSSDRAAELRHLRRVT